MLKCPFRQPKNDDVLNRTIEKNVISRQVNGKML